jgi:hypothetical protein
MRTDRLPGRWQSIGGGCFEAQKPDINRAERQERKAWTVFSVILARLAVKK